MLAQGPVDTVLHSAGLVHLGPLCEAPLDALDAAYQLMLRAPIALTQALSSSLIAHRGRIVFINSGAGRHVRAGWGQYAAIKHALRAAADAFRAELSHQGVQVLSMYPGRTATPMQARVRHLEGGAYEPARYLSPEAVAAPIVEALAHPPVHLTEMDLRPPG